jgi:hypothetical protein
VDVAPQVGNYQFQRLVGDGIPNHEGSPNPDSTHRVYISKTLSQGTMVSMQILYNVVYLILLSDLLLLYVLLNKQTR